MIEGRHNGWRGIMTRACRASSALLLGLSTVAFALSVASTGSRGPASAGKGSAVGANARRWATAYVTSTEPAYFRIEFQPLTDTLIIMLTDTAKIQEARRIVTGVQTDAASVMGTIIKAPAPYNPRWSYHLDPASISFFHCAIEVCDASPQYVEDHLSEVCGPFLPGCTWCPWSSRVAEEVDFRSTYLPLVSAGTGHPGRNGRWR